MTPKTTTTPNLSLSSPAHMKAIEDKDNMRLWARNVVDEFKSLSDEEIKQKLKEKSFPFAICVENFISDLNISSTFRSGNAFGAQEVFYLGNKRFDKRAMLGIHNYTDLHFLSTVEELVGLKEKYKFVAIDNIKSDLPTYELSDYSWDGDKPPMMIFGSEGVGLTPEIVKLCDEMVYIEMYGSVRSLNAASTSTLIMHDFVSKYRKKIKNDTKLIHNLQTNIG